MGRKWAEEDWNVAYHFYWVHLPHSKVQRMKFGSGRRLHMAQTREVSRAVGEPRQVELDLGAGRAGAWHGMAATV